MVLKKENDWMILFEPKIGPEQVFPLRVRVDLRVMIMKEQSTLLKDPGLVPHN